MKIAGLFAMSVPEVKRMTFAQLVSIWGGCTQWSRNKILFHLVLLLGCCSLIFNLTMRLGGGIFMDLAGLVLGLLLPANIYFGAVLGSRRPQIRRFIEEHWAEFNA
ncbi:MAG: hypothetical protein QOF48_2041 [Verrucomicrobiota bacterium]|jgi:hypothetical protein